MGQTILGMSRKPHDTVLHRVVRENLLTFLEQGVENSASGEGYPKYVENELRRFIACGSAELGFARIRCPACGFERLLPFSCKCRLQCPSCSARRMSEEAAYLVQAASSVTSGSSSGSCLRWTMP